ncbi:MAG: hypothetical protein ABIF18_04095 [archaeon]
MKEVVLILFVFLLMMGIVCAENEWGDINDGEVLEGKDISDEVLASEGDAGDLILGIGDLDEAGEKWTRDFYIALGVGGVGILIVGIFIYLFLRGPKNKWKH